MIRLTLFFIAGILICFQVKAQTSDCSLKEYQTLMREAKKLASNGLYDQAIDKLQSAKICQPLRETEVNIEIKRVFEKVNGERVRAEEQTRRVYANDMAYKSQVALNEGDLTVAFRLAELAHRFANPGNASVTKAMFNAYYHNEDPNRTSLPMAGSAGAHNGWVLSLACSPNGKLLASSAVNKSITLREIKTCRVVKNLDTLSDWAGVLKFSPDSRFLAIGLESGALLVWDLESNTTRKFSGHQSAIFSVDFSKDGLKIISGSRREAILLDVKSGESKTFEGIHHPVVFYKKSTQIIGAHRQEIQLWDSEADTVIQVWEGHQNTINKIIHTSDDRWIASCSNDKSIALWQMGIDTPVHKFHGHENDVMSISFSSDNRLIASGAFDKTVKIWSVIDKSLMCTIKCHTNSVSSVVFSKEDSILFSGSFDHQIHRISLQKLQNVKSIPAANYVAFEPKGKYFALATNNGNIVIYDADWRLVKKIDGQFGELNQMCFSPEVSHQLAFACDQAFGVLDIRTQSLLFVSPHLEQAALSIGYSSDGKKIAVGYLDGQVSVHSSSTGIETKRFKGLNEKIWALAFSPDGKMMAMGGDNNRLVILNLYSMQVQAISDSFNFIIRQAAYLPDGQHIVVALGEYVGFDSPESKVIILNASNAKSVRTLNSCTTDLNTIAISPNGKLLATGDWKEEVGLWNLRETTPILTIKGHTSNIASVAFSPDNSKIASAGWDNRAFVWTIQPDSILAELYRKMAHGIRLAPLEVTRLETYELGELLDLHPSNESKLLATRDTWQIAAFADLYAKKIEQTGYPVKTDYERALRLYQACLSHQVDNQYFLKKIDSLNNSWRQRNQ